MPLGSNNEELQQTASLFYCNAVNAYLLLLNCIFGYELFLLIPLQNFVQASHVQFQLPIYSP